MRFSPLAARVACLGFGLSIIALAGCGPSVGALTGKVTYNGTPLKGGSVTLVPDGGGPSFSTQIQEDGTYNFTQVKAGNYKVCVETASVKGSASQAGPSYGGKSFGGKDKYKFKNEPPPGAKVPEGYRPAEPYGGSPAERMKRYVEIPDKYADPGQTPLTVEVKGGPQAQQHDIPLS